MTNVSVDANNVDQDQSASIIQWQSDLGLHLFLAKRLLKHFNRHKKQSSADNCCKQFGPR